MAEQALRALETETLGDRAYRALHEAVVTGELHEGQKVTERGLAERLSMSPTPVRAAIQRLEQEGLLRRTGPRTVLVAKIGDTALREIAEVEVALRGMAARFAARHATPAQIDTLEAILDQADDLLVVLRERRRDMTRHVDALLDLMEQFNLVVEDCADNPLLISILSRTRVFSRDERRRRVRERITRGSDYGEDRYATHHRLVEALRAGDSELAEAAVIEDVRGGLSALLAESPPLGQSTP
jgi:DNA-binding GntR family transcriptional regulator